MRVALASALCLGCAGSAPPTGTVVEGTAGLNATRWLWVEARCVDGHLPMAEIGFERELRVDVRDGAMSWTYDDALPARGCVRTSVWTASEMADAEGLRIDPEAVVTLPADATCGAVADAPLHARVRRAGTSLEVVEEGSPWCRGLDARFTYRRAPAAQLDAGAIARRWVAHFNRRDPDAIVRLFSEGGSLVEPFSATEDGGHLRHEGHPAVRAWLASAFATTPWLAMRLTSIEPLDAGGGLAARWEYMDAHLEEPLHGRNLFAIAGGEIFEAEIQLLEAPRPRAPTSEDGVAGVMAERTP